VSHSTYIISLHFGCGIVHESTQIPVCRIAGIHMPGEVYLQPASASCALGAMTASLISVPFLSDKSSPFSNDDSIMLVNSRHRRASGGVNNVGNGSVIGEVAILSPVIDVNNGTTQTLQPAFTTTAPLPVDVVNGSVNPVKQNETLAGNYSSTTIVLSSTTIEPSSTIVVIHKKPGLTGETVPKNSDNDGSHLADQIKKSDQGGAPVDIKDDIQTTKTTIASSPFIVANNTDSFDQASDDTTESTASFELDTDILISTTGKPGEDGHVNFSAVNNDSSTNTTTTTTTTTTTSAPSTTTSSTTVFTAAEQPTLPAGTIGSEDGTDTTDISQSSITVFSTSPPPSQPPAVPVTTQLPVNGSTIPAPTPPPTSSSDASSSTTLAPSTTTTTHVTMPTTSITVVDTTAASKPPDSSITLTSTPPASLSSVTPSQLPSVPTANSAISSKPTSISPSTSTSSRSPTKPPPSVVPDNQRSTKTTPPSQDQKPELILPKDEVSEHNETGLVNMQLPKYDAVTSVCVIIGVMCIVCAVLAFVTETCCLCEGNRLAWSFVSSNKIPVKSASDLSDGSSSPSIVFLVLTLLFAMEVTFGSLIATHMQTQLHWSSSKAAQATAVFWCSLAVSLHLTSLVRGCGGVLMSCVGLVLCCSCVTGMFVVSLYPSLVWFYVSGAGAGIAVCLQKTLSIHAAAIQSSTFIIFSSPVAELVFPAGVSLAMDRLNESGVPVLICTVLVMAVLCLIVIILAAKLASKKQPLHYSRLATAESAVAEELLMAPMPELEEHSNGGQHHQHKQQQHTPNKQQYQQKTQPQPKQPENIGLELSEGQAKKVSFSVHNNNNSPMSLGRLSIPQSEAKTSGKSSVLRLSKSDKRD
jgi:hypothetical protein